MESPREIGRLARIGLAETHMVEFRNLHRQAGLDIAQTLTIGQLSKRHGSILLGAGKRSHTWVAAIA